MEVERIDHIHIKTNNLKSAIGSYEGLLGKKMLFEADFSADYGMQIAYVPFPTGFELMKVTDETNEFGALYEAAPEGVFAISLKVPDIKKATADMESMGYKLLFKYEFGPVKEALFDTKEALNLYYELIEFPGESVEDFVEEASEGIDITR